MKEKQNHPHPKTLPLINIMTTSIFYNPHNFMGKILSPILIGLLFTLSATTAQAKKMNLPFEILIGTSDVIVTGKIEKVFGDTSYLLTIKSTIKGQTPSQIKVKMFQNWTCDNRWQKAMPGQELLLFLTKGNDVYNIVNGSDGELFIVDNKLRMVNVFNYYSRQYFDEANSPQITDVISSLQSFIKCFSFSFLPGSAPTFSQLKSDADILAFTKTNSFAAWLFNRVTNKMNNYKIIKVDKLETSANTGD